MKATRIPGVETMSKISFLSISALLILNGLFPSETPAIREVGGAGAVSNWDWPAGSEKLANLPERLAFWDHDGDTHFLYRGGTQQFQAAVDALSAIDASRVELLVFDGALPRTNLGFFSGPVHWEFEIWHRESFRNMHQTPEFPGFLSRLLLFGRPIPPPRLSIYLGAATEVDWSEIRIPEKVTLLDRRVATSPWADSSGGVIRAVIRDMETGEPIPGAILEIGRGDTRIFALVESAVADAEGVALLRDIPAGSHAVTVSCEGYARREIGRYQNYGATLGVYDDIRLSPESAIRGRVTDVDGVPVEGVIVGVHGMVAIDGTGYLRYRSDKDPTAHSQADGSFTLAPLPLGRVALWLRKAGFSSFSLQTYPIPGDEITLIMRKSGTIRGRVSGWDSLPANQKIYLKIVPVGDPIGRWSTERLCYPDGTFHFGGVPPDTYTVTPFIAEPQELGYWMVSPAENHPSRQITVESGEETMLILELGTVADR